MIIQLFNYILTDVELNENKTDIIAFILIDADQTNLVLRGTDIYSPANVQKFNIIKDDIELCQEILNTKLVELAGVTP